MQAPQVLTQSAPPAAQAAHSRAADPAQVTRGAPAEQMQAPQILQQATSPAAQAANACQPARQAAPGMAEGAQALMEPSTSSLQEGSRPSLASKARGPSPERKSALAPPQTQERAQTPTKHVTVETPRDRYSVECPEDTPFSPSQSRSDSAAPQRPDEGSSAQPEQPRPVETMHDRKKALQKSASSGGGLLLGGVDRIAERKGKAEEYMQTKAANEAHIRKVEQKVEQKSAVQAANDKTRAQLVRTPPSMEVGVGVGRNSRLAAQSGQSSLTTPSPSPPKRVIRSQGVMAQSTSSLVQDGSIVNAGADTLLPVAAQTWHSGGFREARATNLSLLPAEGGPNAEPYIVHIWENHPSQLHDPDPRQQLVDLGCCTPPLSPKIAAGSPRTTR